MRINLQTPVQVDNSGLNEAHVQNKGGSFSGKRVKNVKDAKQDHVALKKNKVEKKESFLSRIFRKLTFRSARHRVSSKVFPGVAKNIKCDSKADKTVLEVFLKQLEANKGSDKPKIYPTELWKDGKAKANIFEMASSIKEMCSQREAILAALPEDVREVAARQLDQLDNIASTALTMKEDKWKEGYVDKLLKSVVDIREAGITDKLPKSFEVTDRQEGKVVDENGKAFDSIRGKDSITQEFADLMKEHGGNYMLIPKYMSQQVQTSWQSDCLKLKAFMAEQRDVPIDKYYWNSAKAQDGYTEAKNELKGDKNKEVFEKSMIMMHAFSMEMLSNINFEGNDKDAQTVHLYRTEGRVMLEDIHGLKVGDEGVLVRGPAESGSVFGATAATSSNVTEQDVPYHRVLVPYFLPLDPQADESGFMGVDREREFVFMGEGLTAKYTGKV